MTPDRAPTIRQMAEQVAGTLAGEVMRDEFDATGQHGGDWTARFADAIEPVLQAVAAQVEQETRARCALLVELTLQRWHQGVGNLGDLASAIRSAAGREA